MKKNIVIIGAGLVGSLLGIYLVKRGYAVRLFERRGDMRKQQVEAGRSINLALSDRGIKALEKVGIAEDILRIAIPMHGRSIHNSDGSTAFQPYGREGQHINSVSRHELNCRLMDLAEKGGVQISFDHRCEKIDWSRNEILFERSNMQQLEIVEFDLLFGADGAYSSARLQHMLQHSQFEYQQSYIDCGYKEIAISAGPDGTHRLEKNALHIWPRKDYMLIALPNQEGSFTGTLFFPFKGEHSFEKLKTGKEVEAFFQKTFPDVVELVPDIAEQFFKNPVASLVTVKCFPWIRDDKFCLIGDAAHAIVPFFGQGMNAGFEDCRILDEMIEKLGEDWNSILNGFQMERKQDADAIAELALNNFIEMREKTADPGFLLQKKIEAKLHAKHPDEWIPAYSQVTFSPHIRYSDALDRGKRQEAVMQKVMRQPGIEEKWESEDVFAKILQMLKEE